MSCGVCNPEAFRPPSKGRVFGYATFKTNHSASIGGAIPALYFMGCEMVLTYMAQGHVDSRYGYMMLCKVLRKGDRLLIADASAFGIKPAGQTRHIAMIEAMGVEVMFLTVQGKEMRQAA
jgi:hypothetical protein